MATPTSSGMSNDTKTLVTVLLLIFIYPVGLVLMWVWTHWPKWVKILLTIPVVILVLITFLSIILAITLVAINPSAQLEKARVQCIQNCQYSEDQFECESKCSPASSSTDLDPTE